MNVLADVHISDTMIAALVPIAFVMVVGLFTWIVRELSRVSQLAARMEERMTDAERRVSRLEEKES